MKLNSLWAKFCNSTHSERSTRMNNDNWKPRHIAICNMYFQVQCWSRTSNFDYFLRDPAEGLTRDLYFIATESRYGDYNIKNEKIFSAYLKGDNDKPTFVHRGVLNRFRPILESLKTKMQGLKEQAIVFVGRSMGGAVATLATLWYLQREARNMSYFCITFGSPLVGNGVLGEINGREDWTGKFCHVASKYDIVLLYVLFNTRCTTCIDDFKTVLKMLHFTMQGMPFDQLARTCASDQATYDQMLKPITSDLLNAMPIAKFATDSSEMGIALELEAMVVQKNGRKMFW